MTPGTPPEIRYDFLIPPGWLRLELDGDLRSEVNGVVDRMVAALPFEHRAKARGPLVRGLSAAARDACAQGAIDLVLPMSASDGVTLPASFIITPFTPPDGVTGLQSIAAVAASDATAELRDLGGLAGLRTHDTVTVGDPALAGHVHALVTEVGEPGVERVAERLAAHAGQRRVRYLIGNPNRDGGLVLVFFVATMGADPESQRLCALLEELFDLIMASMHTRKGGLPAAG